MSTTHIGIMEALVEGVSSDACEMKAGGMAVLAGMISGAAWTGEELRDEGLIGVPAIGEAARRGDSSRFAVSVVRWRDTVPECRRSADSMGMR